MHETADGDEKFRVKIDGPDGAPVVLMSNSLGCDLTMWDDVVPALSRTYRVVRYDTRGHGGSVVVRRPTSIAELADDALAILDDLGVARAHFVGLSMGGMIGQWLLRHAPDRLDRVVLCNTSAMMGPPDLWNGRIRAARAGLSGMTAGVMERWFSPQFHKNQPEAVARVAAMFEATDPEGYASCCAAIRDMDQRWGLRSAVGDVTVLVGARDPGTTPAHGKIIADAIPGARLVSIDTAHISAIERPQEFVAIVLAALAAPSARKASAATRKSAPAQRAPRLASRARPLGRRAAAPAARMPAADAAPAKTAPAKTATAKIAPKTASPKTASPKTASPKTALKTASAKTSAAKTSAAKARATKSAAATPSATKASKSAAPSKPAAKSVKKTSAATKPASKAPTSAKAAKSPNRASSAKNAATRPPAKR